MRPIDLAQETYGALSANKVRSALTMLGIVIGIASVIAMVSIGQGAQNQISSSIEGLGSNLLSILPGVVQSGRGTVSAGRGSSQTLVDADATAIESIPDVSAVSPELSKRFQIAATNGNNTNTTVLGAESSYLTVHNLSLADGQFISDENQQTLGRVAVLGATTATDLFPDGSSPVGQKIRINGSSFTVIGLLTAKGGSSFNSPDDMLYVPLSTMEKVLSGQSYLSTISVSVDSKDNMDAVQNNITSLLAARHNVSPDNPDFSVTSQDDILGTLSQVITTFTIFLASIAGISLLVGGIGIMNMMLTTVTERTREIGLRKAIGARTHDINRQFLFEAVSLTFIGGFIGVVLGWIIALIISSTGLVQAQVSLFSVVLAFGVSAAIGILFGYYPARRASRLNPIEALRYE